MEALLTRVSAWLIVAFAALLATALGADTAFSVHMGIVCIAALIAMVASMNGFDFVTQRFPALGGPALSSRYDDDPIRWGVIATMFWGIAGFFWSIKDGQFDDADGAALRILIDDEDEA